MLAKSKIGLIFEVFVILCLVLKIGDAITGPKHGKVVVCYISFWAVYRPLFGAFEVENADPTLCTHIIYAFAGINITEDAIASRDAWQDLRDNYGKGGYERVVNLKKNYPHLKVSLAVGGWSEGPERFSHMAKDPTKRARFVTNAVEFLKRYNFDGLDLHWIYPALKDQHRVPEDKTNFLLLILELRTAFNAAQLLLTAAFGVERDIIDAAYDVKGLSLYLDYIHLLSYNYHTPYGKKTGANAPLRSLDELSLEYTVNNLIQMGADPTKLVIGISMNGHSFILEDRATNTRLGTRTKGVGFQGPFTTEDGSLGYNEICLELQNPAAGYVVHWDEDSDTPFASSGEKVISYDNARSIVKKLRLAVQKNLAGVMVMSIDTDDFRGECGTENYPLLRSINRNMEIILRNRDSNFCAAEVTIEKKSRNSSSTSSTFQCSYELIN